MGLRTRTVYFRGFVLATFGLVCATGWAQQKSPVQRSAQSPQKSQGRPFTFDVRRFAALRDRLTGAAAKSKASEERRAVAMSAADETGGDTVVLGFNDLGLPKSVVHRTGVRPASGGPDDPLALARGYLSEHARLFPFSAEDLQGLRLSATSRSGNLTFVSLNQTVHDIPVFGGHFRMVYDHSGTVLQAGVDEITPRISLGAQQPKISAEQATLRALAWLKVEIPSNTLSALPSTRQGRSIFTHPEGGNRNPVITELFVFPMSETSARLAYRVFASSDRGHFEILLDAADGSMLYLSELRSEAGQARVWRESPVKGDRELVDLPDSWLAAGAKSSTGNNADAFLDTDGDDEPDPDDDLPNIRNGHAFSESGVFDFPAGEGSTGQDPFDFPASAVTNAFYFVNLAHDYFYDLGFTETAANLQTNNFGRGGEGNDAVRVETQEFFNFSARFIRTPEGVAPQIELGVDPGETLFDFSDDRDFALDGEVIVHEYAHGVSDRTIGGPQSMDCLYGMQSSALSEGWSDYYGASYFNNPVLGAYTGNNAERGIRRYAYDRNPYTYEDLGNERFESHNDGEIWAAALWDIRKALGAEITDQLVMNSLSTVPCRPDMIDARDALLNADQTAHAGRHSNDMWRIFAAHGMGHAAGGEDGYYLDSNVFTAAFNVPPTGSQNSFPMVTGQPPDFVVLGDPFAYTIQATDPDSDPLHYELVSGPSGATVDGTSGRVTFTPTSLVPERLKIAVTDGKGGRVIHGFTVPMIGLLTPGRGLTINGPFASEVYTYVFVEENTPLLQVTTRGGTGDPDIIVAGPVDTLALSARLGATETLTIANPEPGPWLIVVEGVTPYNGVTLTASFPRPKKLDVNKRMEDLHGVIGSETFYEITVPENASSLKISTGGGEGDVDLYLARDRFPVCQFSFDVLQDCDYDKASFSLLNFESITVNDAAPAALHVRLSKDHPTVVPLITAGRWLLNLSASEEYADVTMTVTLDSPDSKAPKIAAEGVVNAASYVLLLAPGSIGSLFGTDLAAATEQAGQVPLPRTLGGTRVLIGDVEAPLFYASPTQINFQVPFETAQGLAAVVVERGELPSSVEPGLILSNAPGIFTYPRTAEISDPVIVHGADSSVVSPQNPAKAGEVLVVYLTGIGQLTNAPATGAAAPAGPLAESVVTPRVTVGGAEATVVFTGLTPGFVGLVQMNIQLPAVLPAGNSLELKALFGNTVTQKVNLAVK